MQKARLARIHTVKTQSCSAFIHSKMKAQQRLLALETNAGGVGNQLQSFTDEDIFQLQHHHLLSCLERTTVRLSVCPYFFLSVTVNAISYFRSVNDVEALLYIVVLSPKDFGTF